MSTLLRPTPVWDEDAPAGVGEDLLAWTDDMAAVIAPHTPDESYQNFPNRRIENWPQQYYAENWDRLVEVKTRYDRHDLFRNPQSIPPRGRGRHGEGARARGARAATGPAPRATGGPVRASRARGATTPQPLADGRRARDDCRGAGG